MHRTALAEEALEEEMGWFLTLASKITQCCPKVKATLDTMEAEVILEVVAMPPPLLITTEDNLLTITRLFITTMCRILQSNPETNHLKVGSTMEVAASSVPIAWM
jgi:hypothetical protein